MVGMVKNIEHPKRTISFPKKATNIPVTFRGESPLPFPNLWGAKPRSKVVSRADEAERGQRARITHSLLAIANFKNLWKIKISGRRVFFHGGMLYCWWTRRVLEPRGHSDCAVWCFLHNVVGEPLTESGKFLSVSFRALWSQGLESKNIVFPGMDSESYLTQDILIENEQKYFSRVKHDGTVALIRAPKMGLLTYNRYSTVLCSSK